MKLLKSKLAVALTLTMMTSAFLGASTVPVDAQVTSSTAEQQFEESGGDQNYCDAVVMAAGIQVFMARLSGLLVAESYTFPANALD